MKTIPYKLHLMACLFLFTACSNVDMGMTEVEILSRASETGGGGPKISPDGEWIVYTSVEGQKRIIRKMQVDGSEDQVLYEREGYLCCVNFSRDGQSISFSIGNPDLDIWIMNVDGSGLRAITDNDIHDGGASWTYDNSRLVFTSVHNGKFELAGIYTIKPDGTEKTRLHPIEFRAYDPSWSHSDEFVLAQHVDDGIVNLYRIEIENKAILKLTDSDSSNWYPEWSPDDRTIVYRNNDSGNWDIYSMQPDGGERQKLTSSENEDRTPSWSPNGQWLAFQSKAPDQEGFDIWIMKPDGSEKTNLTQDQFDNQGPKWSNDGSYLLYTARIGEKSQVMKINADGSGKKLLTFEKQ